MRKYILNGAVIGAALSAITTFRKGMKGPRDWRLYVSVAASLMTLAVAAGTVQKESQKQKKTGRGF